MSSWKLYLDDLRDPKGSGFVVCRTMLEAQKLVVSRGCPIHISFDHDLGDDGPTGYDFAKWLIERDLDYFGKCIPAEFTFNVHSANPVGKKNIEMALVGYLNMKDEESHGHSRKAQA